MSGLSPEQQRTLKQYVESGFLSLIEDLMKLKPRDHRLHRLPRIELDPEQARVAQHHEQRVALAPGEANLRKVDLPLHSGRGLEAYDRLGVGAGAHLAHEALGLRGATGVAGGSALLAEPHGCESRRGRSARRD